MNYDKRIVNDDLSQTKLAGIVRSLEKGEISRCKKFLQSPYFNSSKNLIKLFDLLVKAIEKSKGLSKRYIWQKLEGKTEVYNDVRFRKFCSDLYKLIRNFLAVDCIQLDEMRQSLLFVEALIGRQDIDKVKKSVKKEAESFKNSASVRGSLYHRHQQYLERKLYELFSLDKKRDIKPNLEEMSNHADAFYLIEKLRLMCEVSTRQTAKKHFYQIYFEKEVVEMLENSPDFLEKYKAVDIYFKMYKLLNSTDDDEQVYFVFKDALKQNAQLFPKQIQIEELYNAAQNYCVRKSNSGESKYINESFEIYNLLIQNDLILDDGRISPWYFRNIVFVGLRLGKYDWVEKFIHDFGTYLPDDQKENAVSFSLAQLYFYQKKYHKVLEQLLYVEYDDLSYNLNSKTILIATYYELDETELLTSHLDTFYTFLNRRKDFPEQRRKPYKNLIKYTRRLIKTLARDKSAIEKLREEITTDAKNVANSGWLLEKLDKLS